MTIQDRLQDILGRTETDIQECANACDAYSKKRLISKVLKSGSWDDKFKEFIARFSTRRGEFEFALALHVGRAVTAANKTLASVEQK